VDEKTNHGGNSSSLIRGLGLWAATAIVIGSMIGQSVFLVASDMSREVGSVTKVLAIWIIGGVVVLFGAFCYAELGAALPEAGGDYIYLRRGLGPVWGFLYGWTSAMIMRPGAAAVIAAGLMRFVGFLWPSATTPLFVWDLRFPFQSDPYQFTFTAAQPSAAGVVVIVTALNYLGVRTAGRFQLFPTALKVATVGAIVALGLMTRCPNGGQPAFIASPTHSIVAAFLTALVPAMLAYNGFQFLGSLGGEVLSPGKNLPRAAIGGTAAVVALYVLVNWVYFHVLSFSQVAKSQHVASDAVTLLVGDVGAKWFTVAMIVSAFGSLHASLLTASRVPYAMARDGNFFSFAKRIQPTFHTPGPAVIFQGSVAILLVLTGTYQELYSYSMFATWIFLALTAVALIRLRVTSPELPRQFRVWGYPFTPVVFGTVALAIAVNVWLRRPARSSIGIAIILLGLPFFYRWRKRAIAASL
jgi:basic amino acid/polyamine antiporter, APA family